MEASGNSCAGYDQWVGNDEPLNLITSTGVRSVDRRDIPISMGQMPEPVPTSKICFGFSRGALYNLPSMTSLNM